jgi:tRNA pseudouridine38-40 synthase
LGPAPAFLTTDRPIRRIKLLLEYDGTHYQGWQSQKSGRTVQDIIAGKLEGITGQKVKLIGASRTDAGVHALGQVAAFSTTSTLSPLVFKRALNAKLPTDIRVIMSEEADPEFHPRFDAKKKSYFYLIEPGRDESAFIQKYLWQIRAGLDLDSMNKAAEILRGRHDFSAFRGSGCSAKTTVRMVYSVRVLPLDSLSFITGPLKGSYVRITIEADAFLRHMVRNMVGTLVEIGKGRMTPEDMHTVLASRDRTKAGPTAPGKGLFLEKVYY